ncbi:MAG: TRAP transporter permease [Meiothermus sp.]|uniref:TRAP transporter permease n=1 Tax=Meiothermus sp. TaxID=1955249 RepID=UPI0025D4BF77|nr:TRAP transporter permease [Meiothermus sp.]MCS7195556.1 TRAP transporter permease [Meiothermus sp.]MCX7740705.1 TRAP transporter permease [Meiothermus sp.]MDW8090484.1 TRAP transporter permease [Meiothermus sp.]MDW8481015.1 TRAP transporter permease [Meiothermus sp.]
MRDNEQTQAQQMVEEVELGGRRPTGVARWIILGLAVGWSLFQVWATWVGSLDALFFRAAHLAFAFALVFLVYPFSRKSPRERIPLFDWVLGLTATLSAGYVMWQYKEMIEVRGGLANQTDLVVGSVTILMLLLAGWRALGPAMPIITVLFMLFALTGPQGLLQGQLPGLLGQLHAGVQWRSLVSQLFMNASDSIWGTPLGVAARTVFVFVLFGAILERAGAGKWFTDLAFSLLGGVRGGPAKASIVSSALTGVVSGSSISNVVTSGTFTIPAMRRAGYSPEKAGAVEVAASSNGQLMPPVMGAAAFIMADFLGVPYSALVLMAMVPALLAYLTLFILVDLEAAKLGLRGLPRSELPRFGPTLRAGVHYVLPLGYLLYALLVAGLSPERAALNTIFMMIGVVLVQELYRAWKRGAGWAAGLGSFFRILVDGFANGARNMVGIAVATALAGIIIAVVLITNIGFGLADLLQTISGGNLLLTLFLAQIISLVLGMGLPTTANYVVMASLVVPVITRIAQQSGVDYGALVFSGIEVPVLKIVAHMFAFYFGIMADSTPPVALAAYAASAIARSNPFQTGVQGFVYELRTALLAYMVFFNPGLLLIGVEGFLEGARIILTALIGLAAFSGATLGYLWGPANPLQRLLYLGAAFLLIPNNPQLEVIGLLLMGLALLWQRFSQGPARA